MKLEEKKVFVHDILGVFDTTLAVLQKKNDLHVLCPWCGKKVGTLKRKEGQNYLALFNFAAPKLKVHFAEEVMCRNKKATVTLQMNVKFLPSLKVWEAQGVKVENLDG